MNTPTHGQNPPENQPDSFSAKIYEIIKPVLEGNAGPEITIPDSFGSNISDIIKDGFENRESIHEIFNRDSLSFTVRDREGRLLNWYVPKERRTRKYEDGLEIGARYFNELRNLAIHNPYEAYFSLRNVWAYMDQAAPGEEQGFMSEFAKAAIAGILAYPNGIPDIPDLANSKSKPGRVGE